jgi:hypothetical protein
MEVKPVEILTEDNYRKRIASYTKKDWQPLLDLIPEIERASGIGEMVGGKKDDSGVNQIPFRVESPVVSSFVRIVYEMPLIIGFDWPSWDEGWRILKDRDFDFDTIDIPEKCKLITSIVRSDRFNEGALVAAFKYGLILRILKSIERQI